MQCLRRVRRLELTRLHHHLRRLAVDILDEAWHTLC